MTVAEAMYVYPFLAAFLMLAAGLFAGLWWGERGRRIAAENMRLYGQPTARPARIIEQPPDAEQRAANLGYSEEVVEKGIAQVMTLAKEAGRPVTREEARQQVIYMLHPDTMLEGHLP